jgi:predicted  nucleic acid-binding Zn-ribbon protein
MRRAERLLELQTVDLALDAARQRVREIDAQLTESDALRAARQADRQVRDRLAQLRARSKDLELQSTALDHKIKTVDERLYSGVVKNPKELNDLQRDVVSLRRQKSDLDDALLAVILDLEQIEGEQQDVQAQLASVEAEWQSSQAALLVERARLIEHIGVAEAERGARRADAPPADLALYDQLRLRKHGQAMAEFDEGVCGACGVEPSAHKVAQLRRDDALLACGNCERILVDRS